VTQPPGVGERSGTNADTRRLFRGLPHRYELLAELLSFGQNGRWRRAMVGRVAATRPTDVLDVATGTGRVARDRADRTDARIVGVDLTE
jgi:demethylmenaquinone methyltransferase / 2-methoxy-6-polyprenyl-1,4-benzoquinol methylase